MNEHRPRQINLNTAISVVIAAGLTFIGYTARYQFEGISKTVGDNNNVLVEVRTRQATVFERLQTLELTVREVVTKSELRAELSIRDQQIQELKKALADLRRKTGSPP